MAACEAAAASASAHTAAGRSVGMIFGKDGGCTVK